jgi:hypothetical protein
LRLTLKQNSLLIKEENEKQTKLKNSARNIEIRRSRRTTPSVYRDKRGGASLPPEIAYIKPLFSHVERYVLECEGMRKKGI